MIFPVVTDTCESWTVKKAERQRIDAFELWCWRRLLRVPWIASKSNQSILRKVNSKYSLEGLMLKLNLQYFGHLMWTADSLEKSVTGKDWGQKEKRASEDEMAGWHHRCDGHELGQTSGDGEGQGGLACCSPWGRKELDMNGRLNNNNITEHLPNSIYAVCSVITWLSHLILMTILGCKDHQFLCCTSEKSWSTLYTTLVPHWPRCRPGLCLDFAPDFVTVNTLSKPELPTSTWQTHIGSCQLLITTVSCYCHPQVSKQFLCVSKMAKWGTAAIWEVQA